MAVNWTDFEPIDPATPAAPKQPAAVDWSQFEPIKPNTDGQTVSGFKRSFEEVPGLAAGVGAYGADLVGATGVRDSLLSYAKRRDEEVGTRHQNDASSFTDAWDGKVPWLDFLANSAGYVAGQALQSIATGGLGAVGAKMLAKQGVKELAETTAAKAIAAGASEEAAKKAVTEAVASAGTKAMTRGAFVGAGAQNLGMELGTIYPTAVDEAGGADNLDGGDKFRVIAAASLAAGVDTAGEAIMASRILRGSKAGGKTTGIIGRAAREVPAGMLREGATEAVQTGLEHYGAGQPIADEKGMRDIIDSAAVGAVGGGLGGGLAATHRREVPDVPAPSPITKGLPGIAAATNIEDAIKAAAEAVTGDPKAGPTHSDRLASVKAELADRDVMDMVRSVYGDAGTTEFLNSVTQASNPKATEEVRARHLQAVEEALFRMRTTRADDTALPGPAVAPQGLVGMGSGPLAIGLDTTPTGRMRVGPDGVAVPETEADRISTADQVRARGEAGFTGQTPRGGDQAIAAKAGTYTVPDAIGADGPESETVRLVVRPDGTAVIIRANGDLIDVTNMVRAGFTAERAIAQSLGHDTTGAKITPRGAEPVAGVMVGEGAATPNAMQLAMQRARERQQQKTLPQLPAPRPDSGQGPGAGSPPVAPPPSGPPKWASFPPASGTLGIPRADMPQIKSEHRGAMTNFMNAREVQHVQEEVRSDSLRATQAEFDPAKVEQALGFTGNDRSILVSSDNYILDGHHQWLAKLSQNAPVKVIRFNAPIKTLIALAHDFPSSTTAEGATNGVADLAKSAAVASVPGAGGPPVTGGSVGTVGPVAEDAGGGKPAAAAQPAPGGQSAVPAGEQPADGERALTEAFEHAGLRVYPTKVRRGDVLEDRWAVQTPENKGTSKVGGDTLHRTVEEAKQAAEEEVARYEKDRRNREQLDAQERERKAAEDERKAANRGKTIAERLADSRLEKTVFENGEGMTRRQWVERKIAEGLTTKVTQEDKIKPMSRTQFNRATNEEQREHDRRVASAGKKDVYWIGDYEVTKVEHDYALTLKPPAASQPKPEPAPATAAPASQPETEAPARPPRSFRKKQMVTTQVYDAEAGTFKREEVDAETALTALDEDINELQAFIRCIEG